MKNEFPEYWNGEIVKRYLEGVAGTFKWAPNATELWNAYKAQFPQITAEDFGKLLAGGVVQPPSPAKLTEPPIAPEEDRKK